MSDHDTLCEIVNELRDALIVDPAVLLRHEKGQKEHAEWLAAHEDTMIAHSRAMKQINEAIGRGIEAHNRAIAEHDARMVEQRLWGDSARSSRLDQKLDRIANMLGFRGGNGSK